MNGGSVIGKRLDGSKEEVGSSTSSDITTAVDGGRVAGGAAVSGLVSEPESSEDGGI